MELFRLFLLKQISDSSTALEPCLAFQQFFFFLAEIHFSSVRFLDFKFSTFRTLDHSSSRFFLSFSIIFPYLILD